MDEVDQSELLEEQPDLEEELSPSGEVPLHWKLLDDVLGVSFAFGPPGLVSLALKQPITLDSEFTGYHLLAMGAGVGIYVLVRAVVVRRLNTVEGGDYVAALVNAWFDDLLIMSPRY